MSQAPVQTEHLLLSRHTPASGPWGVDRGSVSLMSLNFFTPETDVLWVIREQCLLFLSKYLSTHLRIFRGRVENELIALGCLIPGMWQQVIHTILVMRLGCGEKRRYIFLKAYFVGKTLYLYMMESLKHSITLFRTYMWKWAISGNLERALETSKCSWTLPNKKMIKMKQNEGRVCFDDKLKVVQVSSTRSQNLHFMLDCCMCIAFAKRYSLTALKQSGLEISSSRAI